MKDNKLNIDSIVKKIELIDNKYKNVNIKWFSPNHKIEIFLYEYYINQGDYNLCEDRIHEMYRTLGDLYKKYNMKDKAEEAYLKSLEYNPVDLDTYYALCNFYVENEIIDKLLVTASKIYNFCYTKLDMAKYYYYLGQYFKLGFEAEFAYILFSYSNTFVKTKENKTQIEFLEKAYNKKLEEYSIEQLKNKLSENKIPINPSDITLAIVYKVAELENNNGNIEEANQLIQLIQYFVK